MALIKYVGGLAVVRAPWLPHPDVKRGAAVEVSDEDAAALVGQEASPWVYVAEVTFSGKVDGQEIEFTPSPNLEVNLPPPPADEPA